MLNIVIWHSGLPILFFTFFCSELIESVRMMTCTAEHGEHHVMSLNQRMMFLFFLIRGALTLWLLTCSGTNKERLINNVSEHPLLNHEKYATLRLNALIVIYLCCVVFFFFFNNTLILTSFTSFVPGKKVSGYFQQLQRRTAEHQVFLRVDYYHNIIAWSNIRSFLNGCCNVWSDTFA